MWLLVCQIMHSISAYTMAVHSTAQCIQEDTHRCCCWWYMSHHSDRGRLGWRGRRGQWLKNTSHVKYISLQHFTAHYMPHTSDAATDMQSWHCYAFHSLGQSKKEGRHITSLLASPYIWRWISCVLTSTVPPQAYRKYTHWSSGTSFESFVTLSRLKITLVTSFSWNAEAKIKSCDSSAGGLDR